MYLGGISGGTVQGIPEGSPRGIPERTSGEILAGAFKRNPKGTIRGNLRRTPLLIPGEIPVGTPREIHGEISGNKRTLLNSQRFSYNKFSYELLKMFR